MSSRRPPATPPELAGFTYVQLLGSGGFADVYLYQQHLPKRRVAVKVLLAEGMTAASVESFAAEANLMAQLSSHPAIVPIYQAEVAPDGRPYLVMEYCPKGNLQARYRKSPFSVAEALRVGIQVAGAVETAHRAGILHRDIKPANILVTEYSRPALTDFGISATTSGADDSVGMSIPWSPPEAFGAGVPSGVASDVWALGATVYTLMAGRSPFEVPGAKNSGHDLISRIQNDALTPMSREDVPQSLWNVLATSMAKDPRSRYSTALDLARAFQKVQIELSMSVTPVDVLDDSVDSEPDEDHDDGLTRVRSVVTIDPTGSTSGATTGAVQLADPPFSTTDATILREDQTAGTAIPQPGQAAPRPQAESLDATVLKPVSGGAGVPALAVSESVEHTQARPVAEPESAHVEAPDSGQRRTRLPLVIGSAVAGVTVVVAVAVLGSGIGSGEPTTEPTTVAPIDVLPVAPVPVIVDVAGTKDGDHAVFTWTNPDPQPGDTFLWGVQTGGVVQAVEATDEPTIRVRLVDQGMTCIEVLLRRSDGRASQQPGTACVS